MRQYPSPSRIALNRAIGAEKLTARRARNAEMRTAMGLTGNQIAQIKPMSDELKARIEAHSQFGKK